MIDMKLIGENICKARNKKAFTLIQLAKKVGVDVKAMHEIEMGKCDVTASFLGKIAVVLDISVDDLLAGVKIS